MQKELKAVAFGEVLWDILPKNKCLGGAPFNCGCHLKRLGFNTSIISSLGDDSLGREALSIIQKEGVNTEFLKIKPSVPTGFTSVTLENGIPSYEFNSPCAWDQIELDSAEIEKIANTKWNIFCFGSLAQRSKISRMTLLNVLKNLTSDIVFFDVNLRKNFFSKDIISDSLEYTDILKMNDEEVPVLLQLLGYSCDNEHFIRKLLEDYSLKGIIVTLGKDGAAAYFGNEKYVQSPEKVKVVDTVGAGDSFSAAFLSVIMRGGSIQNALKAGVTMANFVITHYGALPEYSGQLKKEILSANMQN